MLKLADTSGYIDIIVYVLLMVGGLVVNAYRNYSKRKEIEKGTEPKPHPRPIMPDILFEPVFEYQIPEAEKKVVEMPVEEPLDNPVSALDTIPKKEILVEREFIEGEAVFESTKEIMISDKVFVHEATEKGDLTTIFFPVQDTEDLDEAFEFDVRQAVIFSEILKPKYF
jgi:hypothetical protein